MQATAGTLETTDRTTGSAALRTVSLRDFRNFARLDLTLPRSGVVVVGPNGSGKSNLVEAIYYLEIFRSFRGAADRELPRFGQDVFRVEATVARRDDTLRLATGWQRSPRRKKVEVDGREPERFADALGSLGAVVFSLDDAELVAGSPSGRRRFLDILLSLAEPGYVDSLQRYRAVLGQRNEALRQGNTAVARAWADGLLAPGATLLAARSAWVRERSVAFGSYHATIADGAPARLRYAPALGGVDAPDADAPVDGWREALRDALEAGEESDLRRGATRVGPHRDDLVMRAAVDGTEELRDLRTYGSGGQRRTAAIALRLVEADTLTDRSGSEPIYLLDDVFAELDRDRSERVFTLLEDGRSGQVVMTAPKPVDLPLRHGTLARWRIRDGRVSTEG